MSGHFPSCRLPLLAAALLSLAVTDAGFSGSRVAAGHDGRIFKGAYYRAATLRGMAYGLVWVGAVLAVAASLRAGAPDSAAAWNVFVHTGEPMLWVYGVYAAVVVDVGEVDVAIRMLQFVFRRIKQRQDERLDVQCVHPAVAVQVAEFAFVDDAVAVRVAGDGEAVVPGAAAPTILASHNHPVPAHPPQKIRKRRNMFFVRDILTLPAKGLRPSAHPFSEVRIIGLW